MRIRNEFVVVTVAAFVALDLAVLAQKGDLTHNQPATEDAPVNFGVLPTGPLGPAPCAQGGVGGVAIGGPMDPCGFSLHHLTPEEVTIFKGGQVSFTIQGGGHAMAIYEVSKDTTRNEVGQFLCPGSDPGDISTSTPLEHGCNGTTPAGVANAADPHQVEDGHGDVVIVAQQNVTNAFPDNRVWSEPGRLMSANNAAFLANGELITYRFLKTGRYLVICMNRSHFLNDWMFGFVNVVGGGGNGN
jgi:plastocyanin